MASINKCIFIGNLGRDPEVRSMPNGDTVTQFSIACTEGWTDKATGEKKEVTEWIRIVAFRKLGDICGQYLKKGSQVYVEGKFKTRKYTDKDGVEKYATEIVADEMRMLGARPQGGAPAGEGYGAPAPQQRQQQTRPAPQTRGAGGPPPAFDDEDIPFADPLSGRNWQAI